MELDDLARDGQAQAESLLLARAGGVRLAEALEDEGKELGADAAAGVDDGDVGGGARARQPHLDAAAFRSELDRVGEQVSHDLLQPPRVARHRRQRAGQGALEADALGLRGRRGGVEGRLDHGPQLERTRLEGELARDDPRRVEQVVDELGQGLRAALDHAHRARDRAGVDVLRLAGAGPR